MWANQESRDGVHDHDVGNDMDVGPMNQMLHVDCWHRWPRSDRGTTPETEDGQIVLGAVTED